MAIVPSLPSASVKPRASNPFWPSVFSGDPMAGDAGSGFYAHSSNTAGVLHDLRTHLEGVARLAAEFARPFGASDWAYAAGLWHDLGKFSDEFQEYLAKATAEEDYHAAEMRGTVDHTTAGAQYAVEASNVCGHLLAYCIAGHHAGLHDGISDGACLEARLKKKVKGWRHGLDWIPNADAPKSPSPVLDRALMLLASEPKRAAFTVAFFARMLFSCLADADFLDTEAHFSPERSTSRPIWPPDVLARMEQCLERFVARFQEANQPVDRHRRDVRAACLSAADKAPGFFSLTVPTGGGKTLSSLAFALRHARRHGLRRVAYVIPFTSIIEQNTDVFRSVFVPLVDAGIPPPVIEHHSALDGDKDTVATRLASENWDAPLIVTTSVQFYESLFANRATRCRKLHNLSKAVIILDEAQKLPVDYLKPCILALRELVEGYGCTIVLCTATQPAIARRDEFPIGIPVEQIREIVPDPSALYLALKRVEVEDLGIVSDHELVERLMGQRQALCVVNTRSHARVLYEHLAGERDIYHLSAAMCPAHRSQVLQRISVLLADDRPCRVISTQLIEAGVDVDFPVVFRSMAGLDSVAQAAGRCNRNGRLAKGFTYLFRSEHQTAEAFLRETANASEQLLGGRGSPPLYEDVMAPEAVEHYFRLYYWEQKERWDQHDILGCMKLQGYARDLPFLLNFRSIAGRFRLIEDSGQPVIVPWGEKGPELCARLREPWEGRNPFLLRALQRYVVQVPQHQWRQQLGRGIETLHERFHVLICPQVHYSEQVGLVFDTADPAPETLII